jgi:hypothetical protein
MILAVEDRLSEVVCRRVLARFRPDIVVRAVIGHRGQGQLRSRIREINRTANSLSVLLLTDLDSQYPCAPSLISHWLPSRARHLNLRVAVREVESWLLADREGLASALSIAASKIPFNVDSIPDPKQFIVNLARVSRRRNVKEDFVPAPGGTAQIGPAFTIRLVEFAQNQWNVHAAANQSNSLARMVRSLEH